MLLMLICLFLNYDLFHCDQVRKFPARSYKRQPTAQIQEKHEHDTHGFIRKEVKRTQSARKAFNADLNFGVGLVDYDIPPMDMFDAPKDNLTIQRTLPEVKPKMPDPRELNLTVDQKESRPEDKGFMDYDIADNFWLETPKIDKTVSFLPTPKGFQFTMQLTNATPVSAPTLPEVWTTPPLGLDPNHLHEYPEVPEGTASIQFPTFESPDPSLMPGLFAADTPFTRPNFPFSVPALSSVTSRTPTPVFPPPRRPTHGVFTDITFPPMGLPYTKASSAEDTMLNTTIAGWSPNTTDLVTDWVGVVEETRPASLLPLTTLVLIPALRGSKAKVQAISKPKNNIWMKVRPGIDKSLMNLLRVDVSRDMPVDQQPPKVGLTISKAASMINNKQWTTVSTKEFPKIIIVKDSTQAVVTQGLMTPGFRQSLGVSPQSAQPRADNITDTATAAGLLQNATTHAASRIPGINKKYHDMMQRLHEGYLGTFLLELTRILSEKEDQYTREVLMPLEFVLKGYEDNGLTALFGAANNTAELKTVLKMVHQVLSDRHRFLAEDVNALLDFLNLFYSNEQGEFLFNTLRDLEMYPKGISDIELCHRLLVGTIEPIYNKTSTTQGIQLKNLLIEVMSARGGRRMLHPRVLKLLVPETTTMKNSSNYKQIYSLKQRMEMKRRRNLSITRRMFSDVMLAQQTNLPMARPRLRSMLPITRNQKRFRVQQRKRAVTKSANMERPTRKDPFRRSGRVVHPYTYNDMLQFFPQIPKAYLRHVL